MVENYHRNSECTYLKGYGVLNSANTEIEHFKEKFYYCSPKNQAKIYILIIPYISLYCSCCTYPAKPKFLKCRALRIGFSKVFFFKFFVIFYSFQYSIDDAE